jgi:hypothetical protein
MELIVIRVGDAKIGMYKLIFIERAQEFDPGLSIVILFNPWSKKDSVYFEGNSFSFLFYCWYLIPDTPLLDEYLLNEQGAVWLSQSSAPMGKCFLFLFLFLFLFGLFLSLK